MIDRDSLLLAGLTDSEIRAMVRRVRQCRDHQSDLTLPKPRRRLSVWKVWRPGSARSVQPMPRIEPDRRTRGQILRSPCHDLEIANARYNQERAAIADRWQVIERRQRQPDYADTPATLALSELGDLQESRLRYVRSLKRAETLLDAMLAEPIRAAIAQDYLPPHPHPRPQWSAWMNDGKPSPRRSAEKLPSKPKRKRKPAHKPSPLPLCGPHPADYARGDGLAAARVLVAETIAQRNAQATYRPYSRENCWQWQESADLRGLPLVAAIPGNDTACDCIALHWEEVATAWIRGESPLPDSMPLPAPQHESAEPTEPIEIPADWPLSPQLRLAAGLLASGASDREIERRTGINHRDIPQVIEIIRAKLPPPLPPIPSEEEASPSERRAIQREAVAQLRR